MKTVRSETILVTKILFIEILFIDLTKKRVGGILKERECPNIWSSPRVTFCPKRTQDRYSGSDWAVIFFSSTYKGRKGLQ